MKNRLPQSELVAKASVIEPWLNGISIFILGSLMLFWDASRAVYVLLCLAAFVLLVRYRPEIPRENRLYSWPILFFFGVAVLSLLLNGIPDGGPNIVISRYLLLVLAVPLVPLFYLSYDSHRNLWIKFAVGCAVIGSIALVDAFEGKVRVGGGHNPSAFGFIALALTAVFAASFRRLHQTRTGTVIFILAVILGLGAMFLSGTRTAWLAAIVVLTVAMLFYLENFSLLRKVFGIITISIIIAISAFSLPQVEQRIVKAEKMIMPYLKGEEQTKFNSLRYRVELWKLGWNLGLDNKLGGFGPGNTKRAIRDYTADRPHLQPMAKMNHIHNQFLQSFAMTGLLGLVSVIVLFACHFWLFARYLGKSYSCEVRSLALAGVLLLTAYLVKSIPGVPFYGKQYLLLYGFSSAIIWGSLLGALRVSSPQASR